MFNLRQAFAFGGALLTLTIVGTVQAQIATPSLKVTSTGVTHTAPRSANRMNTLINHADCAADDVMNFPLTASNFTGLALQAWVGQNCTDLNTRKLAGQELCWKIADTNVSADSQGAVNLQLHVSSIVSGYTHLYDGGGTSTGTGGTASTAGTGGTGGTGGSGGTDTGGGGVTTTTTAGSGGATTTMDSSGVIAPDSRFCDQPNPATVLGATNFNIYFMLLDTGGNAQASATWPGSFKLVGPPAPNKVTAGIGGNLLVVNFSYTTQPADPTGNGYYVYCDPPPGVQAAASAGLLGDGGADGSVGSAVMCPIPNVSQVLSAGSDPPADSKYRCGSGQKTSQTANAANLVDGVPYNVAVAAVDIYENVGQLSTVACEVPQPITGFYGGYRKLGGTAGGGFCSFATKREPVILLAVLGFASILVLRRRRAT